MAEIEAEMRFTACACDFEGEFGSSSVLVKERVQRFQKNRFPSRRRLRQLRIHPELSMEVELVAVETVFSRHIGMRAGNLKLQ